MRMTSGLLPVIGLGFLIVGCGKPQSDRTSTVTMIGTNLNQNAQAGIPMLYWRDGSSITQAKCHGDRYLRSTCTEDPQSLDYETFKRKLENGLSATIESLVRKAASLRNKLETIESAIVRAKTEIAEQAEELKLSESEIAEASREMLKNEELVVEYKNILRVIEMRLERLPRADLLTQSEVMAGELGDIRLALAQIYLRIEELGKRISELGKSIANLHKQVARLCAQIDKIAKQLIAVEADLEQARFDFAQYLDTILMLEDEVIPYRVTTENQWYENNRPFVRRFDAIFSETN